MRNTQKVAAAVVLILVIAMPAGAASRSSRSGSFLQQFKRFIIRVASRVSPPVGSPAPATDETTGTTATSTSMP
jgi:hypothetical protein